MRDSTQIEQLAAVHIIELFSSCKKICPRINIGDKEPLWAGSLFLEERGKYCNWIKHNKKLLNAGELKPERVTLFKRLPELGERYEHVNQHQ